MFTFRTPACHFAAIGFPRIIQRSLLLLVSLSLLASTLLAQDETKSPMLEQGKPIERELAGDAAHSYSITLAANQFLHVVVEQKGIDVVVTLFAPDGKKLVEVDSPNGSAGPEPVSFVTETAGSYRLEVRSLEAKAEAGRYQVKVEELRSAQPQDKNRIAAQQALAEGTQLESKGSAGSRRKAIDKYEEAIPLLRDANDRATEASTLNNIGLVYSSLGEKQKALDYYNQALPLRRAVGDRSGEAYTLSSMGEVYNSLGEKQKALDYYNEALPLSRTVGDREVEAGTLNNIGVVYNSMGEKQKALDYHNQALPLSRAVGDRWGEAGTLYNIGVVYDSLGEKQKALDFYNQALRLYRAVGDRSGEASTLNNIGLVYNSLGEKQNGLDYYNQALPLFRAVGDRSGEATTVYNIGVVYSSLGEKQKALDYYNQALPLRRAVGDRRGEAYTLSSMGVDYNSLGEKQKALDYYNQALPLFRAVGDRSGEAYTLSSMGAVCNSLGEKQKAVDYYNLALPLRRAVGDRRGEAVTLNNIGEFYNSLGEKHKALDYYNQALPLRRAVGDRQGEGYTLANIAVVERDRGNLTEARARIEAALTIFESLRTKIASQELRSSYFATVQKYYEFYIDLLMRLHKQQPSAGHDGAALQASERGRARSLLETLAEANADIRQGVDPTLVARERSLQQRLNAKAQVQMKLLNGPHTDAQAEAMAKEIEALATEYQQIEAEIRQKSPNYAALTQPQPLSLKEIQTQVLDKDTLLLEYSLGDEHSYLWAVTPTGITSYELPKREEIETAAKRVYDLLNARNQRVKDETKEQRDARVAKADGEIQSASSALSRIVLAPVAALLGKKRLVIVADGMLQYIPFAALPVPSAQSAGVGGQGSGKENPNRPMSPGSRPPLIVDHEIVSLPSASTLAVIRREVAGRKPAPKSVVALADPVFMKNDARVKGTLNNKSGDAKEVTTRGNAETVRELQIVESAEDTGITSQGLNVPRLPGSRKEAEEIVAMVPASESRLALDFEANRAMATSAELSQYRYVHFSTHGFLNSVHPELSGIVFSLVNERGEAQDGFLRAHEVFNLKLPAELVVLSACQTGIGKEVKGEGLVSLTRGFMYAGAPRVVVSLWSVSELGTTQLMVRFYREMLKKGLRPAAALRAAQISLMKEKRWASLFYWAAFTLQGEWK